MFPRYLTGFQPSEIESVVSDFLVLGSGVAGLWSALEAEAHGSVVVVTKGPLDEGSTKYAQGGIAAALCPQDSPALHLQDTLLAGAGLCDREAVSILVTEGPTRVRELVKRGARFDEENGQLVLAREGAHGVHRIVRARGDQTGREVERALVTKVRQSSIKVHEKHFVVDVLTTDDECIGVLSWDTRAMKFVIFFAAATILATGGAGQLYCVTTNPTVVTGDGIAMAFRAGAQVQDMEFMQFHPTALAKEASPKFLISEAVRGEGAILLNTRGERFMPRYHVDAELAPRDVVSSSILEELRKTNSDHVLLDLTSHSRHSIQVRFPSIFQTCEEYGIDPSVEPIPVSPAAHYTMGGVKTGLRGETNLKRLYACGEVACTGVHGANRLASNSLLEGLVFGSRAAKVARRMMKQSPFTPPKLRVIRSVPPAYRTARSASRLRRELQMLMWEKVGLLRSEECLHIALRRLKEINHVALSLPPGPTAWELANMAQVGILVTYSALLRTESRGAHRRTDYPNTDDVKWRKSTVLRKDDLRI